MALAPAATIQLMIVRLGLRDLSGIQHKSRVIGRRISGAALCPGIIEMAGEPIRNPVTGAEHRVRIDLPDGFEFKIAEIGSASSSVKGPIAVELKDSYGQFA